MKTITSVERKIRVKPSSRAATLHVRYLSNESDEPITIEDGQEVIGVAGETISNISKIVVDVILFLISKFTFQF